MNNISIKNILIVSSALIGIMLVATLIVIGFNSIVGLSTDMNNEDVSTSIAAVAFAIAIIWKFIYERMNPSENN